MGGMLYTESQLDIFFPSLIFYDFVHLPIFLDVASRDGHFKHPRDFQERKIKLE